MSKIKVLFICQHNSARSQMAEAYLKKIGGDNYDVESAGVDPGNLNPLAIEVMKEEGIDISNNPTKSAFELFKQGRIYLYVIAVCDEATAERCPVFPGQSKRIGWSFSDPSAFTGTREEKLSKIREVRDKIKAAVQSFVEEINKSV